MQMFHVLFVQVKALKEKIEEDRGKDAFPAAGQKLIYAGEPDANCDRVASSLLTMTASHLFTHIIAHLDRILWITTIHY